MLERDFQRKLKRTIQQRLPSSMVLKTDPTYIQGLPDLLILNGNKWAALEVKRSANASHQPNQDYYVEHMGQMSFASFVSPENMQEVLDALCRALEA